MGDLAAAAPLHQQLLRALTDINSASSRRHTALRHSCAQCIERLKRASAPSASSEQQQQGQQQQDGSIDEIVKALCLACDTKVPKIVALALDALQKMMTYGLVRGADVVGASSVCLEVQDASVHLQVLKCLLPAVTTPACLRGAPLATALARTLDVHADALSRLTADTSRAALKQMVGSVYARLEAAAGAPEAPQHPQQQQQQQSDGSSDAEAAREATEARELLADALAVLDLLCRSAACEGEAAGAAADEPAQRRRLLALELLADVVRGAGRAFAADAALRAAVRTKLFAALAQGAASGSEPVFRASVALFTELLRRFRERLRPEIAAVLAGQLVPALESASVSAGHRVCVLAALLEPAKESDKLMDLFGHHEDEFRRVCAQVCAILRASCAETQATTATTAQQQQQQQGAGPVDPTLAAVALEWAAAVLKSLKSLVDGSSPESSATVESPAPEDDTAQLSVRQAFEVLWPRLFEALCAVFSASDDDKTVDTCLAGLKYGVHVVLLLGMDAQRAEALEALERFCVLDAPADMRRKNVSALCTLASIAFSDGNYLHDSWGVLVRCLSRLEEHRLIVDASAPASAPQSPAAPPAYSAERPRTAPQKPLSQQQQQQQQQQLQVADPLIAEQVQNLFVESIFTEAASLSDMALVDLVKALCSVSAAEISAGRAYCLRKLLAVSTCGGMRAREAWPELWETLRRHVLLCTASDCGPAVVCGVELLKDVAERFLDVPERPGTREQQDVLRTFSLVYAASKAKEPVVRSVRSIVLSRSRALASGWRSVFAVAAVAAEGLHTYTQRTLTTAFEIVAEAVRSRHEAVAGGYYVELVTCVAAFARTVAQADVSKKGLALLQQCVDGLFERDCPAVPLAARDGDRKFTTEHASLVLWLPPLSQLSSLAAHPNRESRTAALAYLFALLDAHAGLFTAGAWELVVRRVVLPVFASVGYAQGSGVLQPAGLSESWAATTCPQALALLSSLVCAHADALAFALHDVLDLAGAVLRHADGGQLSVLGADFVRRLAVEQGAALSPAAWADVVACVATSCDADADLFEKFAAAAESDYSPRAPAGSAGAAQQPQAPPQSPGSPAARVASSRPSTSARGDTAALASCEGCGANEVERAMLRCPLCCGPLYCSLACLLADWPRHSESCANRPRPARAAASVAGSPTGLQRPMSAERGDVIIRGLGVPSRVITGRLVVVAALVERVEEVLLRQAGSVSDEDAAAMVGSLSAACGALREAALNPAACKLAQASGVIDFAGKARECATSMLHLVFAVYQEAALGRPQRRALLEDRIVSVCGQVLGELSKTQFPDELRLGLAMHVLTEMAQLGDEQYLGVASRLWPQLVDLSLHDNRDVRAAMRQHLSRASGVIDFAGKARECATSMLHLVFAVYQEAALGRPQRRALLEDRIVSVCGQVLGELSKTQFPDELRLGLAMHVLTEMAQLGDEQYLGVASRLWPQLVDLSLHDNRDVRAAMRQHLSRLAGCRSAPEAARAVARAARQRALRPGDCVVGSGWDQNRWEEGAGELPTAEVLDAEEALSGVYVVLTRVDVHAVWCNSAVIERLQRDRCLPAPGEPDVEGGKVVRHPDGRPTGVFVDNAMIAPKKLVPELTHEQMVDALEAAIAECNRVGLTGVHDAAVTPASLAALRCVLARRPSLRVYAMLLTDAASGGYADPPPALEVPQGPDDLLTVRACKLFADGALGSRGAAMLEDYADEPGNRGLLLHPDPAELAALVERWASAGYQCCTHAIGDAANRAVLDAYARLPAGLRASTRPRVEHAQLLHDDDLPRLAALGAVASMQPTHCTSDLAWVGARVGAAREHEGYRWADVRASGARLCFGSDFPVESPSPLAGLHAAVARADAQGRPWHAGQRLSREDALRCFTEGPAWAAFAERQLGAIGVGRWADFVVLAGDPLACALDDLPRTRVLATFVAGRCVYGGL
eukprot:m51a1_g10203 hypothetical protein (1943) ;mRNA; f:55183-64052